MFSVLVCWIGSTDLRAVTEEREVGLGPIAQAVESRSFNEIALISDFPEKRVSPFVSWLRRKTQARVRVDWVSLRSPTHFGDIHQAACAAVAGVVKRHKGQTALTFHLSPGTPAMAAVWVILSKTRFPAELIESSRTHGVQTVSFPFDISAEFLPDLLREPDERLKQLSAEPPPVAPEFVEIVHRSRIMDRLIARARRAAPRSVPVLIEGESGTGKELLARAIHKSSPRRNKPLIAMNCGAIPSDLIEAELFGHERGAFTGADRQRKGRFEEADEGTLFLDEIGDLPLVAQVKLLRVMQEGEVVRVGANRPIKVDVRVISATHRNLIEEVVQGRFREDLFYRLAVAVLRLPPVRERSGDVGLLIDHFLTTVNEESKEDPGYEEKRLSPGARNVLLGHGWPGNARELLNTLRRAALWSDEKTISAETIREALLPSHHSTSDSILGRPLGPGLRLPEILACVAKHYLGRALAEAHGNKTRAAELVGLPSYQTLHNWVTRYGVKPGTPVAHSEGDR